MSIPGPNMPIDYKKRRAMRKAKKIVKDVLEVFIYSHELRKHRRVVLILTVYPDYKRSYWTNQSNTIAKDC